MLLYPLFVPLLLVKKAGISTSQSRRNRVVIPVTPCKNVDLLIASFFGFFFSLGKFLVCRTHPGAEAIRAVM